MKPKKQITLSLPPDLAKELSNAAARLGATPAQLARVCVRRQLDGVGIEDVAADEDLRLAKKLKRRAAARAAREALG